MKKKTRADLLLVACLLTVALAALGLFYLVGEEGDTVMVTVNGVEFGRYPLSENAEVRIPSEAGGYNLLVIEGGRAYVREASCPDGICAAHHPISRVGESILCKPNRVAVWIEGDDSDGLDVIA